MQTWEMITAVGSTEEIPMGIYALPGKGVPEEHEEGLLNQFGLDVNAIEFIHCDDVSNGTLEENLLLARDARIVRDADIIIPISIRRGGAMAGLVEASLSARKEVVGDFLCGYARRAESLAYAIDQDDINPDLSNLSDRYLFHWTRATNGAWPGERLIDYYGDVMKSVHYPRTAFDTLCRMLQDRLLISSPRHMPGRIATVSFTGLSPEETAPLMRWRARYSEMSFEPYGIGIDRSACDRTGIRAVVYQQDSDAASKTGAEPWLTQSVGSVTDWRQEKEYRHWGDLALERFSANELLAVTRTPQEAREIGNRFRMTAVPFCRV